jgi:hypothetical protein
VPSENEVHGGVLMMLAPTARASGGGDWGGDGGGDGDEGNAGGGEANTDGGEGNADGGEGNADGGEGNADVGNASSRSAKNKTIKVMATAANTVAIPISTISRVDR